MSRFTLNKQGAYVTTTTTATRTSQICIFDNENNCFAGFARAVFIFDISQTFSFFLRLEMTCFAVVWTT